jgi:ElaA protein
VLTFQTYSFNALSNAELYALLRLRTEVFVVQQNCIFQDMDGKDDVALHVLGVNPAGELHAYCRVFAPGVTYDNASIGRVVNSSAVRGTGAGRALMEVGIQACTDRWPSAGIRISAQAYLVNFYGALGFQTVGEIYLEDGIDHVEMFRP